MRSIRIKRGCACAALIVLMLFSSDVSAATANQPYKPENRLMNSVDFSFTVPVKLTDIPSAYKQWRIEVVVRSTSDVTIAHAVKEFTVDSNLTQTFTLKFNADPGKNPSQAIKYWVDLEVKTDNGWRLPTEIADELDWLKCKFNEHKWLPQ